MKRRLLRNRNLKGKSNRISKMNWQDNSIVIDKNEFFTDIIFFQYIYLTFVANYTIYSDIAILIFLGMAGYRCLLKRKIHFSLYFAIDILFILYSFIQIKLGIAVYPQIAFTMLLTLMKCAIINWAIFTFVIIKNDIKRILTVYVYAIFFGIITFFIIGWRTLLEGRFLQYTTVNFLGAEADVHSNGVGIVAALAFIFTVYLFLKNKPGRCFFIGSVLFISILLTGSRKSIILAVVGVFLLLQYMYPGKKLRIFGIASIGIIFSLFLLMNIPFLYEIAGSRIENTIQFFLTGHTVEASMTTRNWLIEIGMKYIRKRPKTGYGLDNFKIITNSSMLYSHNNFVEILFGSGIFGFCIYYSKYVFLLFRGLPLKLKKIDRYYVMNKLLMCLFIIFTIFEYWFVTYYERSIIIVHILLLGFFYIVTKNQKQEIQD